VVDVFNPEWCRGRAGEPLVVENGDIRYEDRITAADFADQTLTLETVISRKGAEIVRLQWLQRYSHRFELELLLEKTGFEILSVWGGHDRCDFEAGSDRLIVVARKPPDADMTVVQFMRAAVPEPVG